MPLWKPRRAWTGGARVRRATARTLRGGPRQRGAEPEQREYPGPPELGRAVVDQSVAEIDPDVRRPDEPDRRGEPGRCRSPTAAAAAAQVQLVDLPVVRVEDPGNEEE